MDDCVAEPRLGQLRTLFASARHVCIMSIVRDDGAAMLAARRAGHEGDYSYVRRSRISG